MLIIPSTSIKSKFLRTLPIKCIYLDSITGHKYIVEEKEHNGNLIKVANPYLGQEEGITINPPSTLIKSQNHNRSNPMTKMKERISFLETQNSELLDKIAEETSSSTMYSYLQSMVGDKMYQEFDNELFQLDNGVVFYLPKDRAKGDCQSCLKELVDYCWKDSDKLASVMRKQQKIQKKLLSHLMSVGGK